MLLQRHRHLKAEQLATELEVSTRTVLRDIEALAAAGVPVWTERGPHGGCHLMDGWHTRATGLTTAETQALFAWSARQSTEDLGLGPSLSSALAKVAATAPAAALDGAASLGSVVLADRRRWFTEADQVPVLPQLRDAAEQGRAVELDYRGSEDAEPRPRTVLPLGVVDHSGRWYLVAQSDGAARMFRVSRVRGVAPTTEAVERVEHRGLEEIWSVLRARLEEGQQSVEFVLRVRPEVAGRLRRMTRMTLVPGTEIEERSEGDVLEWRFRARTPDAVTASALMFAPLVELLEPVAHRDRLLSAAAAALQVYRTPATQPQDEVSGPCDGVSP